MLGRVSRDHQRTWNSFSAENYQFDTLSVHNINYLNLGPFEMC